MFPSFGSTTKEGAVMRFYAQRLQLIRYPTMSPLPAWVRLRAPLPGTPGRGRGVGVRGPIVWAFTPPPRPLSPEYRGEGSLGSPQANSAYILFRRSFMATFIT